MATAKKKTAPKKAPTKATKRAVAVKPVRTGATAAKQPARQPETHSTRVQVLATLFALLCVLFAATAYTNY